jgi:hypothetical protein
MRLARVVVPASIALVALAGTALAARPDTHKMTVALPYGGTAIIEYQGDIAPKVRITPTTVWSPVGIAHVPSFSWFDELAASLDRQVDAIMRQANTIPSPSRVSGIHPNVAALSAMPAGTSSYSVVSTTTSRGTCTRTVETTAMGVGRPPKIVARSSGNCTAAPAKAKAGSVAAPADSGADLNHT